MTRRSAINRKTVRVLVATLLLAAGGTSAALAQTSNSDSNSDSSSSKPAQASGPKPVEKPQAMSRGEKADLREKALSQLVTAATSGTPEERGNAIEALIQTPARLSMVLDAGLMDESAGVRSVSAMAAGKARQTSFISKMKPLLQDQSPYVRSAAMFGLKKCGADVDLTPLGTMLADSMPRIRAQAAFVLGEVGEKSALGPLREAAKETLSRANAAEVKLMDLQIAEARVKLGDEAAIADIRSAMYFSRAEDLEAAILAIQIAGALKDRASINRLIQLTAQNDESKQPMPPEVRMAAAMSLAKLGQPQGSFIAREYFAGEKEAMRAQSAHLFGAVQRPENLHILSRMTTDPDGRVRVAAASAIVKVTAVDE